ALELALLHLATQALERLLRLIEHRLIALGLGELGEPHRVLDLALDAEIAVDAFIEPRALPHQGLRASRIVPELGVLDQRVELGEPPRRVVPVKDASSAAPTTIGSRRRPLEFQRACMKLSAISFQPSARCNQPSDL